MQSGGDSNGAVLLLRSVIDHHLRQFPELELVSLTLDNERNLLISLSKVLKEIKNLTVEIVDEQCRSDSGESFDSDFSDFTSIVSKLILCLNTKSKYVEHLVTNIFVAISEFLLPYGFLWNNLIRSLCGKLELALCDNDAHSIQPSLSGGENLKSNLFKLNPAKSSLSNSTWNIVAGIMGILRGIIKYLKGEDNEFVRVLWNFLSTSLSNASWDVLKGMHEDKNTEHGIHYREDTLVSVVMSDMEMKITFLGNLVQLLCSLVGQSAMQEASSGIHNDESAYLRKVYEFVPKLLNWCLGGEWSHKFKHIFPYFQHKILMLMTRLSYCMQFDCTTLTLWLELLHKYYQDLLTRPISQLRDDEDDVLEGSPFILSFYDKEGHPLSLWHLQRQAVFLFLRCIHMRGLSPYSLRASESNTNREVFAEKKELLDLFKWLESHVPSIMLSNAELNLEKRIEFASSFIKLYIHEDDMLFEMLLLMFTIYSRAEERFLIVGTCQDAREDYLFHISNFFNPLLLFHILLAELKYDHQLLLDYLISKDSGSKCAEYLLRCLRIVCDSWPLFVEFLVEEQVVCPKICKKRRVCWQDSVGEQLDIPLQTGLASSSEHNLVALELKSKIPENGNMNLDNAKACLLSLKSSLQRLHRRKLFPYNPEVLIRRLTMFEDLCNHLF